MLGLGQGVLFFDRLALNYLSPLVASDLLLSNAQIGLLSAAMSITWGSSGYFISALSDRFGRRKQILIAGVLLFSLLSTASGFAGSFASLVAIRCLMGVFEGPILPISQAMVVAASSPARRGLNMGILQNFAMFFIANLIGPLVLTRLGDAVGWRAAFYLTGVPGLVVAWMIYTYIKGDAAPGAEVPAAEAHTAVPLRPGAGRRNQILCVLLACTLGGWMFLLITFLPLYATRMTHLSVSDMGVVMSMIGAAGLLAAVIVPGLSDRFGRKPAVLGAALTAFVIPAVILLTQPSLVLLAAATFIGSFTTGTFPLYISIIPAESNPNRNMAAAIGMTGAAAEVIGGCLFPPIAGKAADLFGLQAPFLMMAGLATIGVCLILFLVETAPAKRAPAALAAQAAS
ncbi:MAG: MFS transporter [Candidatus Binatia bacterium]